MNDYGTNFDAYAAQANDDIAVVVMVESKRAVECVDEILAVDGVDGVFIGPYDLSGSYGLTGQTSHPTLRDACQRVVEACAKHGKSAGMHLVKPTPETIAAALSDGYTFIALGVDSVFLHQAASAALENARRSLAP